MSFQKTRHRMSVSPVFILFCVSFLGPDCVVFFCVHCESAEWKYKQEVEWVQSEGFVREDNSEVARTTNSRITVWCHTECSLCTRMCRWRQSHGSLFALLSSFLDRPQKKKLPVRPSFSCANITLLDRSDFNSHSSCQAPIDSLLPFHDQSASPLRTEGDTKARSNCFC